MSQNPRVECSTCHTEIEVHQATPCLDAWLAAMSQNPRVECPTCHTEIDAHQATPCLDAWLAAQLGISGTNIPWTADGVDRLAVLLKTLKATELDGKVFFPDYVEDLEADGLIIAMTWSTRILPYYRYLAHGNGAAHAITRAAIKATAALKEAHGHA